MTVHQPSASGHAHGQRRERLDAVGAQGGDDASRRPATDVFGNCWPRNRQRAQDLDGAIRRPALLHPLRRRHLQ